MVRAFATSISNVKDKLLVSNSKYYSRYNTNVSQHIHSSSLTNDESESTKRLAEESARKLKIAVNKSSESKS